MTLYHYTCSHGYEGIIKDGGIVRPNPLTDLAWFTDLTPPVRQALGLTRMILDCDRMQYRFTVEDDDSQILPYWQLRKELDPAFRDGIEQAPGALLMHWWISTRPVLVIPS